MAWGGGQRYGRWEARVRRPRATRRTTPLLLLWPDAENFPVGGEIDFMEMSDHTRQKTDFFLHYGKSNHELHGEGDRRHAVAQLGRRVDADARSPTYVDGEAVVLGHRADATSRPGPCTCASSSTGSRAAPRRGAAVADAGRLGALLPGRRLRLGQRDHDGRDEHRDDHLLRRHHLVRRHRDEHGDQHHDRATELRLIATPAGNGQGPRRYRRGPYPFEVVSGRPAGCGTRTPGRRREISRTTSEITTAQTST